MYSFNSVLNASRPYHATQRLLAAHLGVAPVEFPHRTVKDKEHGACYFVAIEIDKLRVAGSKLMIGVSSRSSTMTSSSA